MELSGWLRRTSFVYFSSSTFSNERPCTSGKNIYPLFFGCVFEDQPYRSFHDRLESLRRSFFVEHHPDDPVVLHRTDIINGRGPFQIFQNESRRSDFEQAVLDLLDRTNFRLVASVIDKDQLQADQEARGISARNEVTSGAFEGEDAASNLNSLAITDNIPGRSAKTKDCYGYGYRQLLSAFVDFLDEEAVNGAIIMESREGRQDGLLMRIHNSVLEQGIGDRTGLFFRDRLSPTRLNLRPKANNLSGLQLADILCHSIKSWILREKGMLQRPVGRFTELLLAVLRLRLSNHQILARGNYGYVLCPKPKLKPLSIPA